MRCIKCNLNHNDDRCPICGTPKDAPGKPQPPSKTMRYDDVVFIDEPTRH